MLDKVRPKPDNTNPTITRAALKRAARPIIQKDVLTVISIVQSPNPILNQVCDPCDLGDKSLKKLAKQMAKAMYKNDGCGLAAPQLGVAKRLGVIDCDQEEGEQNPIVLVNPVLVDTQGDPVVAGARWEP